MKKFLNIFLIGSLLLALGAWWTEPLRVFAQSEATPTPPPLPAPTATPRPTFPAQPSPTPSGETGGGGGKKTPTPTPQPGSGGSGLPQRTPTPLFSLTPTLTETPTETLTPTPTIPPAVLRVAVYMDANHNNTFDTGEGVSRLLVLARWETWLTYGYTDRGLVTLLVSGEVPPGVQIAIEAPYLHWSTKVKAPETSGMNEAALRLPLPDFPVFLP